jgi:excisionase family DNA binding protein
MSNTHDTRHAQGTTAEVGHTSLPPRMHSIKDVTAALGVSRLLINDLLKSGEIGSLKIGARRVIPATELQAFINRGMGRAPKVQA